MNTQPSNSIDPLVLQRLIDGELDLSEIQGLLDQAESQPEQWRHLATALVEDQLWHRAVAHLPLEAGPVAPPVKPEADVTPGKPHSRSTPRTQRWGWMALVASLLLGCGLGYLAQPNFQRSSLDRGASMAAGLSELGSSQLAQHTLADTPPAVDGRTLAMYRPDYHLEVPADSEIYGDTPAAAPTTVPLYTVSNAEQWKQFQQQQKRQQQLSPEMLRRISAAGYFVEQDIEFISGDMNQNQRFIVPVRRLRLIPSQ